MNHDAHEEMFRPFFVKKNSALFYQKNNGTLIIISNFSQTLVTVLTGEKCGEHLEFSVFIYPSSSFRNQLIKKNSIVNIY